MIVQGDCLDVMGHIPDGKIDLIYADPPFNVGKSFGEFDDRWDSDKAYLTYMAARFREMHRILASTGSLYLHCDPTMSHYLKVELDRVFGRANFRNEIIWKRSTVKGTRGERKTFGVVNDNILVYSKTSKHKIKIPMALPDVLPKFKFSDERGRYRAVTQLMGDGALHANPKYEWRGINPEHGWRVSKVNLEKLALEDRIHFNSTGRPYRKQYEDEYEGVAVGSIWVDIPIENKKERTGYPTQKPLKLLERIIKASSNKGDLVFDPFCGSGTTLVSAHNLGRRYIGCDISDEAIRITKKRLAGV